MSDQYPQQPQQPNWGQQPTQPGYGYPQQPGYPQPQPPKKRSIGKILGITGGVFVGLIVIAAIAGGGEDGDKKDSGSDKAAAVTSDKPKAATDDKAEELAKEEPAAEEKTEAPAKEEKKDKPKVVTFKVWGTAPAGALGPLDISYGSDSDSRKGEFKDGKFEATLPLKDDAMYYNVMAQLQGSGDINCSVTVDGETKSAHASGDYNICNAQLSGGLFGGWS
jgi:hypothetical protein